MSESDSSGSRDGRSHVYDGIVEHDNKLPLWWQLTLYGAVVFALVLLVRPAARRNTNDPRRLRARRSGRARGGGGARPRARHDRRRCPRHARAGSRDHRQGQVDLRRQLRALSSGRRGGNIGPNLTDAYWIHGSKPTDIFKIVSEGVPAKGMPTWGPQLGQDRIESVVAFVLSLKDTNVPGGKAPQGQLAER